jgi:hypothetical protein
MSNRPGRNDRCPCGSGRKFKKCCLDKQARPVAHEIPPEVAAQLQAQMRQEGARRDRLGNVRPLITTVDQDYRLIAVGSRVCYGKQWRTFTDFLIFYAQDVWAANGGRNNRLKPSANGTPYSPGMTTS